MEIFMKILGGLISLAMIYFGTLFVVKPVKMVQNLQRMKYKETGEPRKIEKTVSIIFGSLLLLVGIYLLIIVVLSFIYPV